MWANEQDVVVLCRRRLLSRARINIVQSLIASDASQSACFYIANCLD